MSLILRPWYHGARAVFDDWAQRRELNGHVHPYHVQSFLSLTATPQCACMHTGDAGRVCVARLLPRARVIDLRAAPRNAVSGWDALRRSDLGRHHVCADNFGRYIDACRSGFVLRYQAQRGGLPPELRARMALASDPQPTAAQREQVMFAFKKFLQKWIEIVVQPYRDLGYDAVVCNEREGPRTICTQLFVFDPAVLSRPEWTVAP